MSTKHDDLTPAERRYLDNAREAEKQGLSLADYYRSTGLSVYALYNARRRLLRKGVVSSRRTPRPVAKPAPKPSSFVAVRVVAESPAAEAPRSAAGMVCRLWHGSGWMIECESWPPVEWMKACLGESGHAGP